MLRARKVAPVVVTHRLADPHGGVLVEIRPSAALPTFRWLDQELVPSVDPSQVLPHASAALTELLAARHHRLTLSALLVTATPPTIDDPRHHSLAGRAGASSHDAPHVSREQASNNNRTLHERGSHCVRAVGMTLHNANRHHTVDGPAITVSPSRATVADSRPSCRDAVLAAIDDIRLRTGQTAFTRRDIVAAVRSTHAAFERQTIYRCLRRMAGLEPGSARSYLEDLGNNRLQLRA